MPWTILVLTALAQGAVGHVPQIAPPTPWVDLGAPIDTVESVEFVPVVEVNVETSNAWKVGLEWPTRALDVALRAVGPLDAPRLTIRSQDDGEIAQTVWISFVQFGFRDDSVAGRRDDVELRLQLDGTYRVRAHERSHACWRASEPRVWTAARCP